MPRTEYFQIRVDPLLKRATQEYCKRNFIDESSMIRMAVAQWPPIAAILKELRKEDPKMVRLAEILFDESYGERTRYVIGRAGDQYCFSWSQWKWPEEDGSVPPEDIGDADNGIAWHSTLVDAIDDARAIFQAFQQTSDDPLWQELEERLPDAQPNGVR